MTYSKQEERNNAIYKRGVIDGKKGDFIDDVAHSFDITTSQEDEIYNKGYIYGSQHRYDKEPTLDKKVKDAGNSRQKRDSGSSYTSTTPSDDYSEEEDDEEESEDRPRVKKSRLDRIIETLHNMSKEKKEKIKEELRSMSKEYLELNCVYGRGYYAGFPKVSESRRDEIKEKLDSMSREDLELNYLRGVSIPFLARGVLLEVRPNMEDRNSKSRQNRIDRYGEMFSKRLDSMSREEVEEIMRKIESGSMSKKEIDDVLYGRGYYAERPRCQKGS